MSGVISRGRLTIPMLRKELAALDSPEFRTDLARVCGEAAGKFVNDGFRRSVDPYGTPWEPLKSRAGQPLLLTGRLRGSFAVTASSTGFRIDATAEYGKYHQYGTKAHQRRGRFQPVDAQGRFQSRKKAGKKKRGHVAIRHLRGHLNTGIPARPMVPTPDQGGLPFKWQRQFGKEARALIVSRMRAAS